MKVPHPLTKDVREGMSPQYCCVMPHGHCCPRSHLTISHHLFIPVF
jgi:hypothetical protein